MTTLLNEKKQSFGLVFQEADAANQKKQFENKNVQTKGLSTPEKLVMIKDSKGMLSTFNVKIIADYYYFENSLKKEKKSIAKNDGNDFDGLLFFNEWDTPQNVGGLRIVKGKTSSEKSNSKSRLATNCSTYTVTLYATCDQFKVLSDGCSISQNYTVCSGGVYTGSSGGEGSTTFFNFATVMSGGGPAPFDILSSSYRQNQVNNFANEAAQYGFTFNPDEKLDFRDNFEDFLKKKDDLLAAIKKWGNKTVDWLENELRNQIRSIKPGERNYLTSSSVFSYRISLMSYVFNAWRAGNIAEATMNSLGLNGSLQSTCGECRVNAIKHAAWIALNCGTFSRWLASVLATEHEALATANEPGEPAGSRRNMDLHNNNIGLQIFDMYGSYGAIPMYGDILNNGMPNNPANGFKFLFGNGTTNNNEPLLWTKDYKTSN